MVSGNCSIISWLMWCGRGRRSVKRVVWRFHMKFSRIRSVWVRSQHFRSRLGSVVGCVVEVVGWCRVSLYMGLVL